MIEISLISAFPTGLNPATQPLRNTQPPPFTFGGSEPSRSDLSWFPKTFQPTLPPPRSPDSELPSNPTSNSSEVRTWEKHVLMYLLHYKYKSAIKPSNCTSEGISSLYCPQFLQVAQDLGDLVQCSGSELVNSHRMMQIEYECSHEIFDGAVLFLFERRNTITNRRHQLRNIGETLNKQLFNKGAMQTIARKEHAFRRLISCHGSDPRNRSELCAKLASGSCQLKPPLRTSWFGLICL